MRGAASSALQPALEPVPQPLVARREDLEEWFAGATAGVAIIYATARALPREAPGVQLVSRWVEEGRAETTQKRDVRDPSRFNFHVSKLADADAAAPLHPADAARVQRSTVRADKGRMLRLLRQIAERGGPCPSHRELGRKLGLKHRYAARYLLACLVEDGRIALDAGPGGARMVRIIK